MCSRRSVLLEFARWAFYIMLLLAPVSNADVATAARTNHPLSQQAWTMGPLLLGTLARSTADGTEDLQAGLSAPATSLRTLTAAAPTQQPQQQPPAAVAQRASGLSRYDQALPHGSSTGSSSQHPTTPQGAPPPPAPAPSATHSHKPLLPFSKMDAAVVAVAAFVLFIAAGAGLGGGPVLVPVYLLLGGFHQSVAVALSNVTILAGSAANVACSARKRHPVQNRPLTDWDLILIMEPATVLGAVAGSYLNRVVPVWITHLLLAVLLILMTLRVVQRAIILHKRESLLQQAAAGHNPAPAAASAEGNRPSQPTPRTAAASSPPATPNHLTHQLVAAPSDSPLCTEAHLRLHPGYHSPFDEDTTKSAPWMRRSTEQPGPPTSMSSGHLAGTHGTTALGAAAAGAIPQAAAPASQSATAAAAPGFAPRAQAAAVQQHEFSPVNSPESRLFWFPPEGVQRRGAALEWEEAWQHMLEQEEEQELEEVPDSRPASVELATLGAAITPVPTAGGTAAGSMVRAGTPAGTAAAAAPQQQAAPVAAGASRSTSNKLNWDQLAPPSAAAGDAAAAAGTAAKLHAAAAAATVTAAEHPATQRQQQKQGQPSTNNTPAAAGGSQPAAAASKQRSDTSNTTSRFSSLRSRLPLLKGAAGLGASRRRRRPSAAPEVVAMQQATALDRMLLQEAAALPLFHVCWLILLSSSVLLTSVFSKKFPCGSVKFWVMQLALVPVAGLVWWVGRHHLLWKRRVRWRAGLSSEGDVAWNGRNTLVFPSICTLAGLMAGMFGLGGAVVKTPLMLELGVHPQVTAATTHTMLLFTTSASTIVYAQMQLIPWDYAGLLAGVAFLTTLVGQYSVDRLIKAVGRASLVVVLLAGFFMVACGLTLYITIEGVVGVVRNPQQLTSTGSIC